MRDFRSILNIIGILICIEAVAMLIPMFFDLYYGNYDWLQFFYSSLITFFIGIILYFSFRKKNIKLGIRQAFLLTISSWLVISIFGEVNMGSSPQLRTKIIRSVNEGYVNLVLDLTSVDFLDSAGLGTIIGALRRVRSQNGDLLLVCPEERIQSIFMLCDLDKVFKFYLTSNEAVDAYKGINSL